MYDLRTFYCFSVFIMIITLSGWKLVEGERYRGPIAAERLLFIFFPFMNTLFSVLILIYAGLAIPMYIIFISYKYRNIIIKIIAKI